MPQNTQKEKEEEKDSGSFGGIEAQEDIRQTLRDGFQSPETLGVVRGWEVGVPDIAEDYLGGKTDMESFPVDDPLGLENRPLARTYPVCNWASGLPCIHHAFQMGMQCCHRFRDR